MGWQFHFRNFSPSKRYFGVYHMGCGDAPWHTGRPRCWETLVDTNPTGGDNSVYVPSDWVVDFAQWFQVVEDISKILGDIGIFVISDGDDVDALSNAISAATTLPQDVIAAKIASSQYSTAELTAMASQGLDNACQQIGLTQAQAVSYMEQMGFGSSGWGLIAGDTYQAKIYNDSELVNGYGWTVLTCDVSSKSWEHIANHAFVQNGHMIQMFDPNHVEGFWNPF